MPERTSESVYHFAAESEQDLLSPELEYWHELLWLARELTGIPVTVKPNILTYADVDARCIPSLPLERGGVVVEVNNRVKVSELAEAMIHDHELLEWRIFNEQEWFVFGDRQLVTGGIQQYNYPFDTALREILQHVVVLEEPEHQNDDARAVVLFSTMHYLRPLFETKQTEALRTLQKIFRAGVGLESNLKARHAQ